jgi:hypothetical protein
MTLQPSSFTFNVGAPTFFIGQIGPLGNPKTFATPRGDSNAFLTFGCSPLKVKLLQQPSSKTLNVGAPTFSPCRGGLRARQAGFIPPYPFFVAPASSRPASSPPRWRRFNPVVSQ